MRNHHDQAPSSERLTSTASARASPASTARPRSPTSGPNAGRRARHGHPVPEQQEGRLVDWIHEAIDTGSGIVINPAAYSFTSIAILDALKMFPDPDRRAASRNIHRREGILPALALVSKVATAVIAGLGRAGYRIAVRAAIRTCWARRRRDLRGPPRCCSGTTSCRSGSRSTTGGTRASTFRSVSIPGSCARADGSRRARPSPRYFVSYEVRDTGVLTSAAPERLDHPTGGRGG